MSDVAPVNWFVEEPKVLVLLMGVPSELITAQTLENEIDRLKQFRARGLQLPLKVRVAFFSTEHDALRLIHEHQAALVHFRNIASDVGDTCEVPYTIMSSSGDWCRSVNCVILENCFRLDRADEISVRALSVIGINGSFAEIFLSSFYARLRGDGLYYEVFCRAQWQFANTHSETKDAPLEVCPQFLTRSINFLEVGDSGLDSRSRTPGYAITKQIQYQHAANEQSVHYELFYATNRKPVDPTDTRKGYSGERDDKLHFGTCRVNVPKSHQIASLGSPWWKRIFRSEKNKDEPLSLLSDTLIELNEQLYWRRVRSKISKKSSSYALIYIHGFNVTFELAALRAAQLGVDLGIELMSLFSWPSQGRLGPLPYKADENSIEVSELNIADYLQTFVKTAGDRPIHIIAHSMGNRALLRAMRELLNRVQKKGGRKFGQIFLAAPDVDAGVFRNLANVYPLLSDRTTLYVSSKDLALATSGFIGNHPRAGYLPPVTVVPGIDTVETSAVDLSLLGHGYFADAENVLRDIHELIQHGSPPEIRFALKHYVVKKENLKGERYWAISR